MPVIDQAIRFRSELARHETQATNQAINAYRLLTNRLEDKLTVLQSKFEVLEAQNRLTPENVRKLAVWSSLLNQVEDEIDKFGGYVDTNNRLAATRSIEMASKHAERLTAINFEANPTLTKAFNATWDRLPTEAIEQLLGFLQEDSQLRRNLTQSLGSSAAQNFQDKLLEGIGLGYNPNKINSLINQTLGEPLTWSLNTIRTTQLYSYREAARANYVNNSEIVGGWKWYAALDGRTCMSCVNQHGREFSVGASLNDHHQGRCTQIPLIKDAKKFGLEDLQVETGEKWFNNLPSSAQVAMMGQDRLRAYRQGKFKFQDLSEPYSNDTFGEMLKERSLKSLLDKKQSVSYTKVMPKNSSSKPEPIYSPQVKGEVKDDILSMMKEEFTKINKDFRILEKWVKSFDFTKSVKAGGFEYDVEDQSVRLDKFTAKEGLKFLRSLYLGQKPNAVVGGDSVEATVIHELGHALDRNITVRLRSKEALQDEYIAEIEKLKKETGFISEYGETRRTEWVAEKFAKERLENNSNPLQDIFKKWIAILENENLAQIEFAKVPR